MSVLENLLPSSQEVRQQRRKAEEKRTKGQERLLRVGRAASEALRAAMGPEGGGTRH